MGLGPRGRPKRGTGRCDYAQTGAAMAGSTPPADDDESSADAS